MQLEPGAKAPMFTLPDHNNKKVALRDYKCGYVVLYFYPKDMTPGCTTQACDFRDHIKKFKKMDCSVIGISRDPVERHLKFREKYDLNFPLLADTEGKICEKYGVWQEKQLYGKKFMGIVRTTFIIGPTGKILATFPKVKVKGHWEKVLEALEEE